MKSIICSMLFCAFAVAGAQQKPVVVVELFTSEGCSSCPPADKLLSSIISQQPAGVEVYGLSFHVDYWNYLGWKDPYAQKEFSERQRNYAFRLFSSVYTPQMVVNGRHRFVGSDREAWANALNEEKSANDVLILKASVMHRDRKKITIRTTDLGPSTILNLAIVEEYESQPVIRGENRGRTLGHHNVVKSFSSEKSKDKSIFSVTVPDDLGENARLIVYTQDPKSWKILQASQIML
ncbi:MAG: DUF1223 domain-containing protein [Bacteroidota bacterium]